jgi:ADP-heptose:LPS heptosyltransferase
MLFHSMLKRDKLLDEEAIERRHMANEDLTKTIYNTSNYGEVIPEVRKIAVLRSNGIGDFIFALPALEGLRNAYPEAEIVLLGLQWHSDFLKDRPSPIDRVEVVPRTKGVGILPHEEPDNPWVINAFFERMAREEFDLAVQLHGGGRFSNPFIKKLGAKVSVGSCTEDAEQLDRWIGFSYYHHEVMRFIEVAALVGAPLVTLEPHLQVTRRDLDEALKWMPDIEDPLVILNPGAGDPRRRWPVEKFAQVGNAIAWEGATVAITGSPQEGDLAQSIASSMSAPVLDLSGELSLNGLAGLYSLASLVISNDSGPLHLARAVGAATVGIYWVGNMINAGPVTNMRNRTAISWRVDCPVCGMNLTMSTCEHRSSIVADVSEVEVQSAALELLDKFRKPVGKSMWNGKESEQQP